MIVKSIFNVKQQRVDCKFKIGELAQLEVNAANFENSCTFSERELATEEIEIILLMMHPLNWLK